MPQSRELKFGCKVTFDEKLIRRMAGAGSAEEGRFPKHWRTEYLCGGQTGVYLGTRTLRNGRVTMHTRGKRDGGRFICTDTFIAAVVSPGPRLNPIYVPYLNLEVIS